MRSFVVFVILVLATGALAAPVPTIGYFPTSYNEECGNEIGITEEEFGGLLLGSETFTSYLECEMERQGIMKDGQFEEEFINDQKRLAEESEDRYEMINALTAVVCIDAMINEGRGAATEFASCTLAASIFFHAFQAESK